MDMFRGWNMPYFTKSNEKDAGSSSSSSYSESGKDKNSDKSINGNNPSSSSSSGDSDKEIYKLIAELQLLRPSKSQLMKEIEKRLDVQDCLIDKLLNERKNLKYFKIARIGITETDLTEVQGQSTQTDWANGVECLETCTQETQTEEVKEDPTLIEGLLVENSRLTEEVKELKQQIALLKDPPTPPIVFKKVCVDVYSPGGSNIENIEDSFRKELESKLGSKHIELSFNLVHGQVELKEPSIVLCPTFSRLGTDVKSVFSAIQDCGRGTVLVVIHHKDEHRLNKVKSEQMLSEYSHLYAILDMAYFTKKGFYFCQINQNSLDELSAFLINFAV